jgi:plastocyanin
MTLGRALAAAVAGVALAATVTGCSTASGSSDSSSRASAQAHTTKRIAVTVKGDQVTPAAEPITISVGQKVELDVTSDRDGVLHVHSSPEHEFDFKPGKSTFSFTLDQPGTVIVEEHVTDALVLKILVR